MIILRRPNGIRTYLDLIDTPTTYSGYEGEYVVVKGDGTGLEFIDLGLEQYGVEILTNDTVSETVSFSQPFSDTNYAVTLGLENVVDLSPAIYSMIVSNKTVNGFTVLFSGDIDSANYKLNWIAKR